MRIEPKFDKVIADLTDFSGSLATDPVRLLGDIVSRIHGEPGRVVTDTRGRITAINPAFSALCGYSFGEVRGKKPGDFLQGPCTDPVVIGKIRESVRARKPCMVELTNYHKDGSTYRVRIELKPFFKSNGALAGFRAAEWRIS